MRIKFEYVRWQTIHTSDEYPDIFFYEVDLESERYATRMAKVFSDRSVVPVVEEGFEFITEEPIPEIDEINADPEYCAEIISKDAFETVYASKRYDGNMSFPKKIMI